MVEDAGRSVFYHLRRTAYRWGSCDGILVVCRHSYFSTQFSSRTPSMVLISALNGNPSIGMAPQWKLFYLSDHCSLVAEVFVLRDFNIMFTTVLDI